MKALVITAYTTTSTLDDEAHLPMELTVVVALIAFHVQEIISL